MSILQQAINRLAFSVQPLVFETGFEDYPYSTHGTVFLVGYKGKAYVITARHALRPENPRAICVFPSDSSQRIIPLKNVFFVPEEYEPEDFVDLAIIEVDSSHIDHSEVAQATLIDLAVACGEWKDKTKDTHFFILGYPKERSKVDYEIEELRNERITLSGSYGGISYSPYVHILKVLNPLGLGTFSGFSGGPVFCLIEGSNQKYIPTLCGMALRGTPESGLIHFLDMGVLLDALDIKRKHEQREIEQGIE